MFNIRRSVVLVAAALVVGLAVGFAFPDLAARLMSSPGSDAVQGLTVGNRAPDFSLQTLDERTVQLSAQAGHPVMVNFWATWCGPCRLEMPMIQERFTRYAPDLVVLAVDFDEPPKLVDDFVTELGLTFPVLLDPGGQVTTQYRVRGFPTSYFIDREGIIQAVHIGILSEAQLDQYLQEIGVSGE